MDFFSKGSILVLLILKKFRNHLGVKKQTFSK